MLVFRTGIHNKMLVMQNSKQKQSDLGLHCLSWPFWQATSVQNFRTFTVNIKVDTKVVNVISAHAMFYKCTLFSFSCEFYM